MGNTSSTTDFKVVIGNTVTTKCKLFSRDEDLTTDNVIIHASNLLIYLPSIAKSYLLYEFFYTSGLQNIVQLIDANDTNSKKVISKLPPRLVEFIKQLLKALRSFSIPEVHKTITFDRSLNFCLVAESLMKQTEGCNILCSCTTVGAFFKYEKDIERLMNDVANCAFKTKYNTKYHFKVMFGVDAGDDISELDKACYETAGLPIPSIGNNNDNSLC